MLNLPKLIGHRGVKNLSPENTIESIKLAKKSGLNWVELDVKISKNLIPLLLHDDSLDRTTDGFGLPIGYNYIELKKLDAGKFFYNKATKIYIPTFEEILSLSMNENINLNIELKPNRGFEKENVESISKILRNYKFSNQYYFSSFDCNSLIMMKEILPNAHCGILVDDFENFGSIDDIITLAKNYNFFCVGINENLINSEVINKILKKDLLITVYSEKNFKVNDANELWSKGVNSIFIDDPTEFKIV